MVDFWAVELMFWESVKDSKDPAKSIRPIWIRYPDGRFAVLARLHSPPVRSGWKQTMSKVKCFHGE